MDRLITELATRFTAWRSTTMGVAVGSASAYLASSLGCVAPTDWKLWAIGALPAVIGILMGPRAAAPPTARLLVLLALGAALAGCSQTNMAEIVKAMAEDKNGYCAKAQVGTPYGTGVAYIARGSEGVSAKITDSGCEVTCVGCAKP